MIKFTPTNQAHANIWYDPENNLIHIKDERTSIPSNWELLESHLPMKLHNDKWVAGRDLVKKKMHWHEIKGADKHQRSLKARVDGQQPDRRGRIRIYFGNSYKLVPLPKIKRVKATFIGDNND